MSGVKKLQLSATETSRLSAVRPLPFEAEGYRGRTSAVAAGMWGIQPALESRRSAGEGCTSHEIIVRSTEGKVCQCRDQSLSGQHSPLLILWENFLVRISFHHSWQCLGWFPVVYSLQQLLFFAMAVKLLGKLAGVSPEPFQEFWSTAKEKYSRLPC